MPSVLVARHFPVDLVDAVSSFSDASFHGVSSVGVCLEYALLAPTPIVSCHPGRVDAGSPWRAAGGQQTPVHAPPDPRTTLGPRAAGDRIRQIRAAG